MSKLISKIVVPDSSEATGYALYNVKDANAIPASEKGVASGVATLDSSGKVPSSQLPSYVDDVIEGYYHDNKFYSTYTESIKGGDDAAQAAWGEGWRMPTTAEFQALGSAVNTFWTSDYNSTGIAGLVCTDKTDSSKVLFFPATGYARNDSVSYVGSNGSYWSSSLYTDNVGHAYRLYFGSSGALWDGNYYRYIGYPVRPILASGDSTRPYVEIGGVKWSTMNIGAESVTDAGLYFQWGDIQGYTASQVGTDKVFNWANYKYCDGTNSVMTKYNSTDELTTLALGTPTGTYSDEITAETGKIYVDISTNQSYRWSGSTYIVISSPYVLPTASASTLGGVKVGNGLSIDNNGVLSAEGGGSVEVVQTTGNSTTAVMSQKAVSDELDGKVNKIEGMGLSTNDYTTNEKDKLAGIAEGAEVNVQSDWNATSGDALILNKPTIPTNTNQLINGAGYITSSGSCASTGSLNYKPDATTSTQLDSSHWADKLNVFRFTGFNTSILNNNGIIIDGGWSNTDFGFQILIDDDPTYVMGLRQKGTGGWNAWKRIPMGDGTGASGTWGISITGNATKATQDGDGNTISSTYLKLSGDTMTGKLTVKSPIFGYNYTTGGNNCAAFILDKPGANYSGIGAHATSDTIYFGACDINGAWVDTYKQKWTFNGSLNATSIYLNGVSLDNLIKNTSPVSFVTGTASVIAGDGGYIVYLPYTEANARKVYACRFYFGTAVGGIMSPMVSYHTSVTVYGKTVTNCFLSTVAGNPGTVAYRLIVEN